MADEVRLVKCVKFSGEELPGLEYPPLPGELGDRIWANVSEKAWNLWMEHMKMIINEYRLNLADPEAQKLLFEQCEKFFFGEGSALPPGYVPEGQGHGGHGHGHHGH
jgi:Fe-S cluster biosynthesis and repair protein YggX